MNQYREDQTVANVEGGFGLATSCGFGLATSWANEQMESHLISFSYKLVLPIPHAEHGACICLVSTSSSGRHWETSMAARGFMSQLEGTVDAHIAKPHPPFLYQNIWNFDIDLSL